MLELRLLPRGLVRQISLWVALSTALGLGVFACVAIVVVIYEEEAEPDRDAPEVIMREARDEVGEAMLVAAPLGLLLAVAGAAFSARRVLRPLADVTQSASNMTVRELSARLPLPTAEGEVRAVVLALNGLFARLESGFASLDRFAADASHELRTPLTVIGTELEVMLQRPRSSEQWEASARLCLDEVRHLTRLVNTLLDLARAQRMNDCDVASSNLRQLVEHALALVAPAARAHAVHLEAALGVELERTIRADGAALQSALLNVIENAVQYTPSGGEVRVWSDAAGADSVLVHVDDSGPGIDPNEQQRVFQPFVRGPSGRSIATGYGLGLTIARRFCEHNRSSLSVGQSPSGGARFTFTFWTHGGPVPPFDDAR